MTPTVSLVVLPLSVLMSAPTVAGAAPTTLMVLVAQAAVAQPPLVEMERIRRESAEHLVAAQPVVHLMVGMGLHSEEEEAATTVDMQAVTPSMAVAVAEARMSEAPSSVVQAALR